MFDEFKKFRLTQGTVILIIAMLVVGLYANSIKSHFSGSDTVVISGNESLRSFSNLSRMFSEEFAKGYGLKYRFYRPLQFVVYMIEYSLWKLDAQWYHIVNIGLHIGVALGLFWLVGFMFEDKLLAFLTSLFFITHPIHTKTVSFISNSGSITGAFFLVVSFMSYIKATFNEDKSYYMMCLLAFLLALFCYEGSLVYLLFLLCYHFFMQRRIHCKEFVVLACFGIAYFALRTVVLSHNYIGFYPTLADFFSAFLHFIRFLLVPVGLYRGEIEAANVSWFDIQVLTGVILCCLIIAYIIKRRGKSYVTTFGGAWFLCGTIPFFGSYYFSPFPASIWNYLATMGFCLILARCLVFIYRDWRKPKLALILAALLTIGYSVLSFQSVQYWRNPQRYYRLFSYSLSQNSLLNLQ